MTLFNLFSQSDLKVKTSWIQKAWEAAPGFLNAVILILLTIATIFWLLEKLEWLPKKMLNRLTVRRVDEIVRTMRDFGVSVNVPASLASNRQEPSGNYIDEASRRLETMTRSGTFEVGKTQRIVFQKYFDLMGGCTDGEQAGAMAILLSTHCKAKLSSLRFDFVVGIKAGTPTLAYEFGRTVGKPVALFGAETKYRPQDFLSEFDALQQPPAGQTGLIVDDSTTGGRKVEETAKALRKYGYLVADCLVVFAPRGKDQETRLIANGITLHSIIDGPTGTT
jgi:orotate phosphoribosyltransferase